MVYDYIMFSTHYCVLNVQVTVHFNSVMLHILFMFLDNQVIILNCIYKYFLQKLIVKLVDFAFVGL